MLLALPCRAAAAMTTDSGLAQTLWAPMLVTLGVEHGAVPLIQLQDLRPHLPLIQQAAAAAAAAAVRRRPARSATQLARKK